MRNYLPSIKLEENEVTVQFLSVTHKFILDWKIFFLIALSIAAITYVTVTSMRTSVQEQAVHQNKQFLDTIKELLVTKTTKTTVDTVVIVKETAPVTPKQKATIKKTKAKDNLANTYSNIGFIVNPTYAKRHNIDPAIVAYNNKKCYDYIKRYAPVAKAEMKRYNVPASITLAQGLLESNAGESRLARNNNNHFGIKCFSKTCKKGHCGNFTDDTHKDFFRNYSSSWESYRAHSVFLNRSRYKHLTKSKDYKKWAHGLKKAGYATDKKYAHKLIKIIEVMKLYEYDGNKPNNSDNFAKKNQIKTKPVKTPKPVAKKRKKAKGTPRAVKTSFNPFEKGALPVAEKPLTIGRSNSNKARATAKKLQELYDIE